MKILLVAYACEPNKGSEPEVGWRMVNELAKAMPHNKFSVITKANNQNAIEAVEYPKNIQFYYYKIPRWLSFWKKGGRGIRTYYYFWCIGATRYLKLKKLKFDIVNHLTFVNDWLPSPFYKVDSNAKFVWGPIGSHDPISFKFLPSIKLKIIETFRIMLQKFFRNIDPVFYSCKRKSDLVLGINEQVKDKLKLSPKTLFEAEPAIAISQSELDISAHMKVVKDKHCFRIITVGRLIYIKNFRLTLLTLYEFLKLIPNDVNVELLVVGIGPDYKELKNYSIELGLERFVKFAGQVTRDEVQELMLQSNVFLFPTLENAGFVILEAMNCCMPVIAMNYGGPNQFVRSNMTDQLVSHRDDYEQIAKNLAANLSRLYFNPDIANRIGERNSLDVLNFFTWDKKALRMKDRYENLVH